ncbi:MAG: cytochrome b/b6 domain-containing protein, partial [Hyphomicrobiaceae bacterium]|nr:cytochrome b/b6 domain-containing protein [Hyphomicrobiaceae bacterium]
MTSSTARRPSFADTGYSATAKFFHWTVATLVVITVPIGFIMADRGRANIWDATTNQLYSAHKLIGLTILALMLARLAYRLTAGAPEPAASLSAAQRMISGAVHWGFYVLLIGVAIGGWLGISYFGALNAFGIQIPALFGVSKNEAMAKQIFAVHAAGGIVIAGLILLHVAGALF